MTNTQFRPHADTFAKLGIVTWPGRLLCWFAAFPYAAFTQLSTPSTRVWVVVRGFAVIISPLVFTLALASNGARFIGHTPYLYLLPLVVLSIDWLLIARSYILAKGSGALLFMRTLILLISGFMALFAGVLSESESLLQRLHRAEDVVARQDPMAQNLDARLKAIDEQIARNDKDLMTRDAVDAERLKARRLEQLECGGKAGVDPETGIYIKGGGKCGTNAMTHRINAEAVEARLAKLTRLENENIRLAEKRGKLKNELSALFQTTRSPADSIGTLIRSLKEADAGLWAKLIGLMIFVMVTEAFALIMSEIDVPQTLRTAVQFSDEVDQIRLQVWRDGAYAEVAKQRAAQRTQAADGLAPLEVTLTAVSTKLDAAGERQPAENRVEELV